MVCWPMWNEHPALNDFGNWAAPLAPGIVCWGPCPEALPQAGMGRAFGPRHSERRTRERRIENRCFGVPEEFCRAPGPDGAHLDTPTIAEVAPLPARHERGEGRGEGLPSNRRALLNPSPHFSGVGRANRPRACWWYRDAPGPDEG